MIYSGTDLIRTSGQQVERLGRLKVAESVAPISEPKDSTSNLDDQTQSALLRFAKFVHGEGEKKKQARNKPSGKVKAVTDEPFQNETPPGINPYAKLETKEAYLFGRGQSIDVYI